MRTVALLGGRRLLHRLDANLYGPVSGVASATCVWCGTRYTFDDMLEVGDVEGWIRPADVGAIDELLKADPFLGEARFEPCDRAAYLRSKAPLASPKGSLP